ncbi:MAG: hypothetical protein DRJ67_08230 [Thermoprotei archaeon]|nr:MAG: hypothetical protein DRJ67_08230 [Thermoprotei archaeon]
MYGEGLVWSFTNSGIVPGSEGLNPRSEKLEREHLKGVSATHTEVKERPPPRLVLAFYYPWYGNPAGPSHRWFHWNNPPGVAYESIAAATDYPLMGPYDSWDARVVKAHIAMAKAAGIDGFICSWWGINTFEDIAFARILNVAKKENFYVTIYYESVRELSEDDMVRELSYVLKKYSSHPAFLKIDGKPAIFIYAVETKGRSLAFWRRVLERVGEKTNIDAVYIGDTYNLSFLTVFEGLHTYNPIWIENHNEVYRELSEKVKSFAPLSGGLRRFWCATVAPGYDDRKIRKPGKYVSRREGAYYEKTWRAAIDSGADLVLICTWNEWHEGTEIEPSREYGFKYLDLTRRFAEEYKNITLPLAPAPELSLKLEASESETIITLENVGVVPAVAVELDIKGGLFLLDTYSLPVNSSRTAAFIPYLGPGERVTVHAKPMGEAAEVEVKVVAWSPTGARAVFKTEPLRLK